MKFEIYKIINYSNNTEYINKKLFEYFYKVIFKLEWC